MGLPVEVQDPALVRVGGADVGGAGDDLAGVGALLVGDVVDGESIFIVAVADFSPDVFLVWTAVDDALGVVDVTICGSASGGGWVGWVAHIDEDQARTTSRVARLGSHGKGISGLEVDNNIVRTAELEVV